MLAPNLFWKVSRVLNIYSIGDGLYMKRVLDGIASLGNSGTFLALGAFGLLLGIMIIATNTVMEHGQRFGIAQLFTSFLVFIAMFGIRCDVIVQDLGGAPGTVQGGTYAVDNVPFGVAVAGSMISTLGLVLTEKLDQGFSMPSGSADASGASGFGRSLEWINAVRNWELPEFDDSTTNHPLSRFRNNVSNYIANCTLVGVGNGAINMAQAQNAADPFTFGSLSGGGIGYANRFVTTKWEDADHTIGDQDCYTALTFLKNDSSSSTLFTALANAASVRAKRLAPGVPAEQQLRDAFADVGIAGDQASAYVATSAINAVWTAALRKGSDPSGLDIMSAVMVNQGSDQRATQWAADESMFRQVARPMTAFFESMIFALAPFMALVVGLGAWGVKKVQTYMVLSLWVALWLPMASIINLFQNTMVQHAVTAMQIVSPGASPLPISSMAGAANLQHQIINWIATGSALIAATPAITMTLLFGGAVAATALSGKLQGAEFSNEKLPTPDAVKDAPVMERKSHESYDQATGLTATNTGSMAPSYSASLANQRAISSSSSALQSASQTVTASAASGISSSFENSSGQTVSGSHAFSNTSTKAQQEAASWGREHGYKIDAGNEAAWSAVMTAAVKGDLGLASEIGKGSGISGGVGASSGSTSSFSEKMASRLGEQIGESAKNNASLSATLATAATDTVQQQAQAGSRIAEGVTKSDGFLKANSDMSQLQQQYSEATSRSASLSASQTMTSQQVAQALVSNGGADAVINAARQHAGYDAFRDARAAVDRAPWQAGTQQGRDVQAAMIALQGDQLSDRSKLIPGHDGARQSALVNALAMAGGAVGKTVADAASGDAARNSGLAGNVRPGAATSAVSGQGVGSGLNAGDVMSRARGTVSGATDLSSDVEQWAGIAASLGNRAADESTLSGYRGQAPGNMSPEISSAFERENDAVGKTAGAVRSAAAENSQALDPGGVSRSMKSGYNTVSNWADNRSSFSVEAALGVARDIGNGVTGEALDNSYLSTLNSSYWTNPAASFGHGITADSAMAAATDPAASAKVTADFEAEKERIAKTSGVSMSPELITALAATSAVRMNDGASQPVAQAYFDAKAKLSEGQLKFLEDWSDVSPNQAIGGGVGDLSPATVQGGMDPSGLHFPKK
jgi:hypothetical protein